jgi:hypothetical protein
MQEAQLIHRAVENLYATSGIIGDVQEETAPPATAIDGFLRLMHKAHTVRVPFISKRHLTMDHVAWLKSLPERAVVVFAEASNNVKEQLRENNLSYLEVSGNAFLSLDNFFLFIDTAKTARSTADKSSKAFSKTGLKIVYSILSNTNALETNYRNLAELSGTSIDSVGRVLHELVADKYLVKTGNRGFSITNNQRLLKDWAIIFNKTLRPKLKARVFDFHDDSIDIRSLLHQDTGGFIGGELAAESMENQLISRKANVYVEGSFVDFALKNNLKPAKNGRITLVEKFWNKSDNYFEVSESLASPTLVYADLMNDPSPRNLEAANEILKRNFHEPV